jgi:serine protease Do
MTLHRMSSAALVVALAMGILSPVLVAASPNPRRTPIVDVVERVKGAVVNIHSERLVRGASSDEIFAHAPSQNRVNGMGTGIIIDPRGYIVTNQHVVDDVSVIRAHLCDGSSYNARILMRDPETDLALLKIDPVRPLATMPLGTSSDLMVGETVIAIGNAYGYEHSVTVGVVSAIKRDVTLNKELSYKSLIQTDASINPGNSGGPLLNVNGELIGVNVAIRAGAQGIGFAIPVDNMIRTVAGMLSMNRRSAVWHGLVCHDVLEPADGHDQAVSKSSDGNPPTLVRTLVVDRTEQGSPAAQVGLKAGDVVVRAGDVTVACSLDLERGMLDHSAGDTIPLVIRRKTAVQRLELTLQGNEPVQPAAPSDLIWRKLGLRLRVASPELVSRANARLHGGLTILDVNPDGPAFKAGMQRGDILVGLHLWETVTIDNVTFVLTHAELATFNPLRFYIVRSGELHQGVLPQLD